MTKHTSNYKWFLLGLLGITLGAPNATVIKYTLGNIDPYTFNTLRFGLIALITLPFIVRDRNKLTKLTISPTIWAGVFMAIAVVSYVWALKLSQASYVSIVTLLTPIIFVIYSAKLTGEKISSKALAGITLAAMGAFVIVCLPIAFSQNSSFVFYPLATFFVLINTLTFPLSIIFFKKSNEAGLPLISLIGVSSWVVFIVSLVLTLCTRGLSSTAITLPIVWGVLYSGVVVALLSRMMNVASYERIGSAAISALFYVETLLAIIIPIIVLGEHLSVSTVIGGSLILAGTFFIEYHRSAHHKHHHIFRNH